MNRMSFLFEEDIDLQDSLEDIQTFTDDSEDIIIGAMENRANEEEKDKLHLFTDSIEQVNDDGLTPEEENEINLALLDIDDDDIDDLDDDML